MTNTAAVTAGNLNFVIEIDSPFRITDKAAESFAQSVEDGMDRYSLNQTIETDLIDVWAPGYLDHEIDDASWSTWSDGYSGQYSYTGPVMPNSKFLGGRMAVDLLSEAGTYVLVAAYWSATADSPFAFTTTDRDGEEIDVTNEWNEFVYIDGEPLESEIEGWVILRLND